jgi:hypothetical protein
MITADLHGNRENFEAILRLADLDAHPRRHLVLQEVCHGGPCYPDGGGCMSHQLLEDVARLEVRYPNRIHFLLSNHELAELTDFPILKGYRVLNLSFRSGMHVRYGAAHEVVHEAYVEFLKTLPLALRLPGDVLVSHSAPPHLECGTFDPTIFDRPLQTDDYVEGGSVFRLVWGRDYRPENARAFAKLVGAKVLIHGHEPCPGGSKAPNDLQVIIDCCSRPATYLMLPLDRPLTHGEIVARVQQLP